MRLRGQEDEEVAELEEEEVGGEHGENPVSTEARSHGGTTEEKNSLLSMRAVVWPVARRPAAGRTNEANNLVRAARSAAPHATRPTCSQVPHRFVFNTRVTPFFISGTLKFNRSPTGYPTSRR